MSLRINTNVAAINTKRQLNANDLSLSKTLEKLSSGLRINRASDDAAGLSISEKLRGQVGGLAQATRNAQDGISLLNTAEGALIEVHSMLQRLRDLSVQSANGTLTTADRDAISSEAGQLITEISAISNNTTFNTQKLLDGSLDSAVSATNVATLQIGANQGEVLSFSIDTITATSLGYASYAGGVGVSGTEIDISTMDLSSQTTASDFITIIDSAIQAVSHTRSNLGALSNRLEHTINNLGVSHENLSAAESRIRDADMADEISALTRKQILQQASTAMLAQANSLPQGVLSLLQG